MMKQTVGFALGVAFSQILQSRRVSPTLELPKNVSKITSDRVRDSIPSFALEIDSSNLFLTHEYGLKHVQDTTDRILLLDSIYL